MKKNPKEIVIINQDSGYLMIDIANAYIEKGYKVSLITGRLVERNHPLNKKVHVSKIMKYVRSSTLKRLFTWAVATLQILFLIWFTYRKQHLFIVSNPPFATLLPVLTNNSFSLLIYDIYPDALVEYQILKEDSYLIQKWKKANRSIFKRATKVFTISEGMKHILGQYAASNKIEVVPIWTDNSFLKPVDKEDNPFLEEQGIVDKFIVMYSGNLGKTHHIEVMIDLAEELFEQPYFFLIIGGGDQFESIKKTLRDKNLKNLKLLPWQSTKILPYTLAAADIGMVSLGKEASNLSIPSKTYNLMSVGVPILSIADPDSELAKLVKEKEIGMNFEHDQILEMKTFIKSLKEDKMKKKFYKENSLALSNSYGSENAYKFMD